MSQPANDKESRWISLELGEDDRTISRPQIDDETQIVRYVRLSTLLLHLSGQAFIPSLLSLRSMDNLEGQLAVETALPDLRSHFDTIIKPFAPPCDLPRTVTGQLRETMEFADRSQWWFKELAKRRAVWCWNLFDGHSNAMWRLYGSRGVLIHSTIGRVKRALTKAGRFRGLVSPVRYRLPGQLHEAVETFKGEQRETWPSWYLRPYLLKQWSYRYEQELRFVFAIHPTLENGISIEVDRAELIDTISVSPEIPSDEGNLLIDMLFYNQVPNLRYPAHCRDEWLRQYAKIGGTPFTPTDEPAELYRDLDPVAGGF
jgi:hypothetical protein